MESRDVFTLEAIIEFCDKITKYLDELAVSRENFLDVPRHQDLCAFYCLQIGEYANTLSDNFINSHPEIAWHRIVAFRNNIAHEYGSIDPEILYDSIIKDIPVLREFCVKAIS